MWPRSSVPRPTRTRIDPADLDAVTTYDERHGHELISGVVAGTPIPSEAESDPDEELGVMLRNYRANHSQGTTLDLTLPERQGRVPDTARDIPSVVVEFVSGP